ncbi:competence protein CoiA family protein [uncultured Duncaniella sp.]|uniref:competence protein CoiA family protein n=1 Tax=uncultured Duncaniella sp. TaxID=2768039 RepID=UPI0025A97587|nr:competence protein CoiA family protein [uncultured Duncaniella sp.]
MINKPYLTYALDADGKLIHIDSVSRGLACKCFCPHCKSELVAKNGGNLKVHHFAHANGRDCIGAKESALHKMAKDILQEHKLIMLPSIQLNGTGKQTVFSNVEAEVFNKELSLRPDCIGYTENSQFIWVEFKRTHEVDVKKAGKIISAKVDCVEIDLNSCELDPIKVKSFIENSSEGRKWIYNHENPQTFQVYEKNSSIRYHDFDYNCGFGRKMPRHIAIDEQNTIVNLYNLDEIDANKHIYFCVACGKEVFIDVDDLGNYSFAHLDENAPCEDDFYLHEAAKKVLCGRFNTQQKFDVYIPQRHLCEKKHNCTLFNDSYCSVAIPMLYDLKAHGYDSCEIEYKFPYEQFSYDAVLRRGDDLKTAIIIVIDADTCHIEPENLKNRTIEVTVRCENDVFKLYEGPLRGKGIRFFNFEDKDLKTISWEKINRRVLKFTLFSSGKYYLGAENCMSPKKRSAIYEMVISQDTGSYKAKRQYAVLRCYNNQKVLCLCEICYYLRHVEGILNHENICIRYKTKGTPRNPLETMPIKCPFFSLDRNLGNTLEKEFYDLEFIEKGLIDK